ncbi:hypothetical protein RJ55_04489 [Drechmeria coniospora]|nr:hypothetical protein RJ55_04489 [Drechmeria coniospora]
MEGRGICRRTTPGPSASYTRLLHGRRGAGRVSGLDASGEPWTRRTGQGIDNKQKTRDAVCRIVLGMEPMSIPSRSSMSWCDKAANAPPFLSSDMVRHVLADEARCSLSSDRAFSACAQLGFRLSIGCSRSFSSCQVGRRRRARQERAPSAGSSPSSTLGSSATCGMPSVRSGKLGEGVAPSKCHVGGKVSEKATAMGGRAVLRIPTRERAMSLRYVCPSDEKRSDASRSNVVPRFRSRYGLAGAGCTL